MSRLQFQLQTRDGRARRGRLTFPRGTVETPAFMPVGTYGSVKGILPDQVRALGAEIRYVEGDYREDEVAVVARQRLLSLLPNRPLN